MSNPVQRHASAILLLTLLRSSPGLTADLHGLPHEVLNVTQAIVVPQASVATVTEPLMVNYTTTELFTTTQMQQCSTSSSTRTIHSIIFPSPDAAPIEVTSQSQVLTSYVPEMTWCVLPPIQFIPSPNAPFLNISTNASTSISATSPATVSCETVYAPILTTVCATTLTALASKITVTDCNQEVTFSTECGFALETPTPTTSNASLITPAPTVRKSFTYWLAPWQSLTAGETPSDVDVKICKVLDNGDLECSRYQEVWEIVMVTRTLTTTRPIGFTATVSGPGTLIVATLQAVYTDTIETIDLSTTLLLETEVEIESTSTGRKSPKGSESTVNGGTSTLFVTKTVVHKSTSSTSDSEPTTTVTLTSVLTRTGTTTITRPRPSSSS
ncbi:hypothetical protein BDU57DRAFT_550537 [Ampelomyces quisqualis]|uniref:Uncharacterized protein n=1 Tax=Ampelomyces quisqualis TaxID=50730 RepID=A0A6A5QJ26_AMPQU|nr:hypothetical protein BDU57DRAFT_550537 [Ampelomyces quisqualis]